MQEASEEPANRAAQLAPVVLFALIAGGIAALRIKHCLESPANTGDLWRHLNYGRAVNAYGLHMAGLPLVDFLPNSERISWAKLPYNYPVLTLLFFTGLTSGPLLAWPAAALCTLAKVALTALEGLNAIMLGVVTRDRWLGLIYWASPLSIWWASNEGQFEPLANVFSLLALLALERHPALAFAALAGAIQVKVIPGTLLFWLLWKVKDAPPRTLALCAGSFALAFLPSALAQLVYPHAQQVLTNSAPMQYNPYYWNIFDVSLYNMPPAYEPPFNQVAIKAYLLATLWCAWRSRKWMEYLPALLFLLFCSLHYNVVYWYFLLLPPLYAPVSSRVQRRWFIGMTFALSVWGLTQIFTGPTSPM